MGKGDRKTAKGKRSIASYGNVRSHVAAKATGAPSAPVAAKKTASKAVSKAPAKKVVAKKATSK
ncbi:MAG TPA: 30S ribosomal protein THX [Luteimonas sp.]|nr:30S ribosomal protein THX [Luteimonas sp.]